MDVGLVAAGLLVGGMIGLTGMGGGTLTTPFLILFAGVRPVTAVGTDLAFAAVTKWFGAFTHLRRNSVDVKMVTRLASGSVPGSILGVVLLSWLGTEGAGTDRFVTRSLGVALVFVSVSILFGGRLALHHTLRPPVVERHKIALTIGLGFIVGVALGMTSVGSGTLIMAVLLLMSRRRTGSKLVSIDVVHGALLVTVAAAAHWRIGTIDWAVAASLLAGSIPGVMLGSRLAPRVPERVMRPTLATILFVAGTRLL